MFEWLFRKKAVAVGRDLVWFDLAARDRALVRAAAERPVDVIVWFDETFRRLERVFAEAGSRAKLHRADLPGPVGPDVIVAERHPLPEEDAALAARLGGEAPMFYTALDDALMLRFGGERVTRMMTAMGMQPDEPIEHAWVTTSLAEAHAKVAARLADTAPPGRAPSMAAWLDQALGPPG